MIGADRPGARLLESLASHELRGRPGPARQAALDAAARASNGDEAADHLLDAVCASLVAGEPGRALTILERDELGDHDDQPGARRRQTRACRAWAAHLRWNWYPGQLGAELPTGFPETVVEIVETPVGDAWTRLLEATVARGPVTLLSANALITGTRGAPDRQRPLLSHFESNLAGYAQLAAELGDGQAFLWAHCCRADLAARAGLTESAIQLLNEVRSHYTEAGDRVGLARTLMLEGDWYATPGSSPEGIGFDLPATTMADPPPSPYEPPARAAYREAEEILADLDEPRLTGALALRRAVLALRSDRPDHAEEALASARQAWSASGDAAGLHLLVVHGLLVDLAADRIAAVRREAGAGWALEPRGPLAEIVAWANRAGSPSLCTGFGRLAQAMAGHWRATGHLERASAAYTLSVPLIGVSGAVSPSFVLDEQADLDAERGFGARALARLEQAVERMPPVPDAREADMLWLSHVNLTMSIVAAQQNRVTASPTAMGLPGLQQSRRRLDELAQRSMVPADPELSRSLAAQSAALDALVEQNRTRPLGQEASDDAMTLAMITQATSALTDQSGMLDVILALSKGRLAFAGGWIQEADRWFAAAMRAAEQGGPARRWLGVLILAAQGRDEEARSLLRSVITEGFLPDELLGSLALRARAPEQAASLLGDSTAAADAALPWSDRADRAELALQLGDHRAALQLAEAAIEALELEIGVLARDPDRVAKIDDVKVPALYLVAARAALGLADASPDQEAIVSWRRRAVELIDRPRALAITSLVQARAGADGDALDLRWQGAATSWAAQFDRLLATYEGAISADDRPDISAALTEAEDELLTVEAEMERLDGGVLTTTHLPPPLDAGRLQRSLPAKVCLVELQLVGRELLTVAMTADEVITGHHRFERPVVEQLANRLWRRCAAGDPGPEAAELSAILFDPIEDLVAGHPRLIVVPIGAVNAVPFASLPFRGSELGTTHVISYLPSLSLLDGRAIDEPVGGDGVTVVGDPAFDTAAHPGLGRLPGAAVEARAVADVHDTEDCLVDGAATEPRLRQLLEGRSIVHLAAHGRLDEVAPSTSSIVLADRDELTVADLIGMRVGAGLVVLSACDSGRGAATLGGDLVGLTRGLLAAGVERAVVSLWPVDDVIACVTMARFHRALRSGTPPAEALAGTQREVREMDRVAIDADFALLGGDPARTARRSRRADGTVSPSTRTLRLIADGDVDDPDLVDDPDVVDDPDFVDEPDSSTGTDERGSGRLARNWAPFVLVGP